MPATCFKLGDDGDVALLTEAVGEELSPVRTHVGFEVGIVDGGTFRSDFDVPAGAVRKAHLGAAAKGFAGESGAVVSD